VLTERESAVFALALGLRGRYVRRAGLRSRDAIDGGTFPVDLGVTLLDSTGLLALLKVLQLPCGKDLIVQPSPQVFTLLRLANLVDGTLPSLEVRPPGGSPPP
jgi:hypothetical protein